MKRTIIIVIAVVLALSVGLMLLLNWAMFGDQSSFQKGLAKYEGVPATASDHTVLQNPKFPLHVISERFL